MNVSNLFQSEIPEYSDLCDLCLSRVFLHQTIEQLVDDDGLFSVRIRPCNIAQICNMLPFSAMPK